MKHLTYSMKRYCAMNRSGSFATISARTRVLTQAAEQLHELGFRGMKDAKQLKPKHIWALVGHWKQNEVNISTIKNRMSHLRWLAEKTDNPSLIAKSNSHYQIDNRVYVSNQDKSLEFRDEVLASIPDPYIRLSAELQKHFGLRREEAMKFIVSKADKGHEIELQGSWTKGGKPRSIPVRTAEQRELLNRIKLLSPNGSLIPSERKYVQQMRIFEKIMHNVGLGKTHGARHLYAQNRYQELSGRLPPAAGGESVRKLSPLLKAQDNKIRLQISQELGHERAAILSVYIGY